MSRANVVFVLGVIFLVAAGLAFLIAEDAVGLALAVIFLFCGIANLVAGFTVRWARASLGGT